MLTMSRLGRLYDYSSSSWSQIYQIHVKSLKFGIKLFGKSKSLAYPCWIIHNSDE